MSKVKVLYVSDSFYPAVVYGGPIYSAAICLEALKTRGVMVSVLTTNSNGIGKLDPVEAQCEVKERYGLDDVSYYPSFKKQISPKLLLAILFKTKDYTLVHVQGVFSFSTVFSLVAAKFYDKKLYISSRGSLGEWCLRQGKLKKKIWLNLAIKPLLGANVTWHVTSQDEKKEVCKVFGMHANTFIAPNGLTTNMQDSFTCRNRLEKFGLSINDKYILTLGRIERKKGIDITLDALSILGDKNLKLVVAGPDYGELQSLRLKATKLGLDEKVKFVGEVHGLDKALLFSNAEVFCLNSRNENFGNVYLEALSVGVPVIASDKTPWDMLEVCNAGFQVENVPIKIAQSIENIISNRSLFSEGARKLAGQFSWKEIAKSFELEYSRGER